MDSRERTTRDGLTAESRRGTAVVGKSGVAIHCGEGLVLGPEEDVENRLICMDFI